MKKNISINIGGIIFHIEEDGYESLKKYLDSINRYFASFEDSAEILADIEGRIAEIFLSKLNEGKQVITLEDINALISTMGSVRDFQAAEEKEENAEAASETAGETAGQTQEAAGSGGEEKRYKTFEQSRSFVRDHKRKILGGVCAGIARYANIDAVWIRLIFALLAAFYGITVILYVILWIVMPGAYDLEDPVNTKKMYRDPENKALAGVSGGLAAYFGIDIVVVRILFILSTLLGGLGLIVYIVLWISLPEARTITDRMQMQGEPVTLSNIESTVKKELNVKEGEESAFVKILLFPFRLIAFVITGLGKVLGPALEVVRVLAGILIILMAVGLIVATVGAFGALLGLFVLPWPGAFTYQDIGFPIESVQNMIPGWMSVAAFVAAIVPCLFILMLGFTILNNRVVLNASVGWLMFIALLVSLGALSVGIPRIVYNFSKEGEYKVEQTYAIQGTPVFKVNEVGMDEYDGADLTLKGYEGKEMKLVQYYEAQGSSRQNAIENAQMITYGIQQSDSILTFDSNITFNEKASFRAQRLRMNLFIPYDTPFVMDASFSRFINQYVKYSYLDGYIWKMTDDGLECLNCNEPEPEPDDSEIVSTDLNAINDFDEIDISGKFDVTINYDNRYAVDFTGPVGEREKYNIYKSGNTLVIDYEGKKRFDWNIKEIDVDEVRITITLPRCQRIKATGYGALRFDENHETINDFELEVIGPVKVRGTINAKHLVVNLTGNSEADLGGKVATLNADITMASRLKAYQLEAKDAVVEATGASSAKVNVTGRLEMEERLAGDIDYRGNPTVITVD